MLLRARPLDALLLSDGKPGHYHQAEGVIAALARLGPVATTRLEVRRRFVIPTRTLLQLVNAGLPSAHILRLGYGLRAAELPRADVVVSAGGETLAANAAAAKALGAANIFCGPNARFEVGACAAWLRSMSAWCWSRSTASPSMPTTSFACHRLPSMPAGQGPTAAILCTSAAPPPRPASAC